MKSENPTSHASPGILKIWVASTRPKTLIAGISPVLIGSASATFYQPISWVLLTLCLLFSLFLQIGTNWANDYFDFIKGTDTPERIGPIRAIHTRMIAPKAMRSAAILAFAAALIAGLPLIARMGIAYLPLPFICIACGILYTGGKRPLGYLGLGDLLVFIFYGPVATIGSALVQLHYVPANAWTMSLIPGSLSCAILSVNNLRDVEEDRRAKKMTLVARFGIRFGQWEYALLLCLNALAPLLLVVQGYPASILWVWVLLPLAKEPLEIVFKKEARLNDALALTARYLAFETLILCLVLNAHLFL
jgi:1,4-dihydroxy-2-naphthoate polyprenyltransferase